MDFDIRVPTGLLFVAVGLLLAGYGLAAGSRASALGVDIDLVWGVVLTMFGAANLILSALGRRKP